ncbi:MAG: pyrroline-5-carboxylate reductase [Flexilinea sp.]|nr:pyrroline-5-carboxylate reductase [Flexilinea sp.]
MNSEKMAIIGIGVMGKAILTGILKKRLISPQNISVYDTDADKMRSAYEELGVNPSDSGTDAIRDADVILIAVKPQFLSEVFGELKNKIHPDALVISIVAGVPIEQFQKGLDHERVVRVMPNTPAQIGEGVSGWFASREVTADQRNLAQEILACTGYAFELKSEDQLDQITAVSGSGPAYVFLFIEAMIDTAVHLGLSRPLATEIVIRTVKGSTDYLAMRKEHPAVLRNEVTSPGGTTAEAVFELEKLGFRNAIAEAMWACYERTIELGKGSEGSH